MSREFYFRVWDNNSKIMYYHNIKIDENGKFEVYDECNDCYVYNGDDKGSDLVLMQGIFEKEQKLYVGDIIKYYDKDIDRDIKGIIKNGVCEFVVEDYNWAGKNKYRLGIIIYQVDVKKMGNIYENSGLLK